MKTLQKVIQIVFLALFGILVIKGKIQIWALIFAASLIATIFLGRVYCGWMCPINTVMKAETALKKKLRFKGLGLPSEKTGNLLRVLALLIFVGLFAFTMISGKKLPVLPAVFIIGILLTMVFPEKLWHRYLCPYGALLSIPASFSILKMKISKEKCIGCSLCARHCPTETILKDDTTFEIKKTECLVCMKCKEKCKKLAI